MLSNKFGIVDTDVDIDDGAKVDGNVRDDVIYNGFNLFI